MDTDGHKPHCNIQHSLTASGSCAVCAHLNIHKLKPVQLCTHCTTLMPNSRNAHGLATSTVSSMKTAPSCDREHRHTCWDGAGLLGVLPCPGQRPQDCRQYGPAFMKLASHLPNLACNIHNTIEIAQQEGHNVNEYVFCV